MSVPVFDCDNWDINAVSLSNAPITRRGPRALSGFRQTRRAPNNYWRGTVTLNPLYGNDMIDFRGFISALHGSSGVFDMCLCEPYSVKDTPRTQAEWLTELGFDISRLCGPINGRYSLPFSDGSCFSQGMGFHIPDYTAPAFAADAVAGASSFQINDAYVYLRRGHRFSTSDSYLHEINCVSSTAVEISPPLRRDMVAGEVLEAAKPKVRLKLSEDTSGQIVENFGRWTDEITLAVEEVFDR